MEPATLLFAEVFGMIAIAVYLTVAIGLDRSGPGARLGIVSCALLRGGETCDRTCVGGIAQA